MGFVKCFAPRLPDQDDPDQRLHTISVLCYVIKIKTSGGIFQNKILVGLKAQWTEESTFKEVHLIYRAGEHKGRTKIRSHQVSTKLTASGLHHIHRCVPSGMAHPFAAKAWFFCFTQSFIFHFTLWNVTPSHPKYTMDVASKQNGFLSLPGPISLALSVEVFDVLIVSVYILPIEHQGNICVKIWITKKIDNLVSVSQRTDEDHLHPYPFQACTAWMNSIHDQVSPRWIQMIFLLLRTESGCYKNKQALSRPSGWGRKVAV